MNDTSLANIYFHSSQHKVITNRNLGRKRKGELNKKEKDDSIQRKKV